MKVDSGAEVTIPPSAQTMMMSVNCPIFRTCGAHPPLVEA